MPMRISKRRKANMALARLRDGQVEGALVLVP